MIYMSRLLNIVNLRLRLIWRDKATITLAVIVILLMTAVAHTFYENIEEISKIPIAIVDEDNTELSIKIIENISNNDLLRVEIIEKYKALRLLKNNEVEAVFIFYRGFEEKVWGLEFEKIVGMKYITGNNMPVLLSDVVASDILPEVGIITAVNYLETALKNRDNKEDLLKRAYSYGERLKSSLVDNYFVQVEFIDIDKNDIIDKTSIERNLLFKKIVIGIVLSFITLFIMFSSISIVKDNENKLSKRITCTSTSLGIKIIGDYLSVILASLVLSIIFSFLIGYYSDSFFGVFNKTLIIIFLFIIVYSGIGILLSTIFSKVTSFVVGGTSLVVFLGIISGSFFNIDFTQNIIRKIARTVPNYHATEEIMNIVVRYDFLDFGYYIKYVVICILTTLTGAYFINSYKIRR